MSWISPTFGDAGPSAPPPKKKAKRTKTPDTETRSILSSTTVSSCNWLQQYKPMTVDELAVNVKKVKELQDWLQQSTGINSTSKFLLLSGPSGCGKTTTLQILCKAINIKILEWITPLDKPADESSRFEFTQSAAKQFEEYLFRSSRYNSCLSSNITKKIILVKDFPNAFLYNPSTLHVILETFSEKCVNPVVFICSDVNQCRKLFPAELKANCRLETITFNPIPDQRMSKVLKGILFKESRNVKPVKALPNEAVSAICAACGGDLRSAITKLYFCTIDTNYVIGGTRTQDKFKKPTSHDPTEKDKTIDFFQGIGRVLYPKKIEAGKELKFVHSTEAIVDSFLCEPNNFVAQLHENYPSKLGNIQDLSDAADRLAKSDLMMTRWQDKDIFHTYALSVAVQGLMVANRNPQKAKFEAFRKSHTSRLEIDIKAIELEGKAAFSNLCILDYECLIDILPYSRLVMPSMNSGQIEYVRKTCQF